VAIASTKTHPWRAPVLLGLGALAASFMLVRSKTRAVECRNPPTGQFIEVDGVRLHYVERGKGPPLVLLHGNGVFANDFDVSGLIDKAAQRYRVIAFDRPGYGYSERPRSTIWTPSAQAKLLHKALVRLGVSKPVVVGHSWGTLVALAMALEFPDDVSGLVLVSGYYYPSLRLDVPLASPPAIPIIGDLLRFTLSPLLGWLMWPATVKNMFSPLAVPARFRHMPRWMMLRPSQLRASAVESALMVPSAMMLSRHYRELKVPVRILAGSDDRVADPEHNSARLHRELAGSDYRVERGVGHMLHYAYPDDILAAVDALTALPVAEKARRGAPAGRPSPVSGAT
jgi:pimeloyl-ACP methyl ester carboxylesterase